MQNAILITRNPNPTLKERFMQRLHEIEQLHIDWFKKRPAIFDQHKHDSLLYHTFSEQYGNTFSFIFWKHSELPDAIKNECIKAFEEVFEDKVILNRGQTAA